MACTTEQAGFAFENAKAMAERFPSRKLRQAVQVKRWHIEHGPSKSKYKALSGKAKGKHGSNCHAVIADEVHEYGPAEREIFAALRTSMGHRQQPMTICITTAGYGGAQTLCKELHDKAVKYLTGQVQPGDSGYDDQFYPLIFAAPPDAPWDSEETWARAIPGLGETVSLSFMRAECVKAKESPAAENDFRRLYLCQWTSQSTRWFSLDTYDARTGPVDLEALAGQPCYVGIDLSNSFDLTAIALIFPQPEKWLVHVRCYCPADTVERRSRDEGLHYRQWADAGHLIATEGSTTDFDRIERDLIDLAGKFEVKELAYDPWNATSLINHLESAGIIAVPVYQQSKDMPIASKEFERRLVNGGILIDANPVTRFCAANVEVERDRHQNIRPKKPMAKGNYAGTKQLSIDAIVAIIIGVRRAMLHDVAAEEPIDVSQLIAFI